MHWNFIFICPASMCLIHSGLSQINELVYSGLLFRMDVSMLQNIRFLLTKYHIFLALMLGLSLSCFLNKCFLSKDLHNVYFFVWAAGASLRAMIFWQILKSYSMYQTLLAFEIMITNIVNVFLLSLFLLLTNFQLRISISASCRLVNDLNPPIMQTLAVYSSFRAQGLLIQAFFGSWHIFRLDIAISVHSLSIFHLQSRPSSSASLFTFLHYQLDLI